MTIDHGSYHDKETNTETDYVYLFGDTGSYTFDVTHYNETKSFEVTFPDKTIKIVNIGSKDSNGGFFDDNSLNAAVIANDKIYENFVRYGGIDFTIFSIVILQILLLLFGYIIIFKVEGDSELKVIVFISKIFNNKQTVTHKIIGVLFVFVCVLLSLLYVY